MHVSWSVFDGFVPPQPKKSSMSPSWSAFDGFERPSKTISWQLLDDFIEHGHHFAAERCRAFPGLLAEWDQLLAGVDGDPCRSNWSHFRPLRVDREEDWSDWLQHFIATSASGALCHQLFSRSGFSDVLSCARPRVFREDIADDRRADLVITWGNGERTHLEVKVGDQSFEKTAETASKLEQKYAATKWSHYILLPVEDVMHWDAIDHPDTPLVHVLTWDDVATALRRSLRRPDDGLQWRGWAHGFCGLVEQRLLGHPCADDAAESLSKMGKRMNQISIMKRGLEDV